jgi:hypothetical protein
MVSGGFAMSFMSIAKLLPVKTQQRVEKVGFELIATTNRAQNAPKVAF